MKKNTFNLLKWTFILTLLGFIPQSSNATHLMGSDFTYECAGQGKFKLILKIYRDCRGVPLGGTAQMRIEAPGCATQTINAPRTKIADVTPKCASATGPCGSPNTGFQQKGIEEHTYETIIDFTKAPYSNWAKNGCCKVYFSWTSCCRNGAITTGVGGGFYSYAMLDICNMKGSDDTLCNNSPQLTNPPVAFACCNQPFTYNNGASDNNDYDSLSYQMVPALGNSRTNSLYPSSPLTELAPMTTYCLPGTTRPCTPIPGADPPIGFFLDKTTGDIIFTPTDCSEVGVMAIQINEWRKDTTGKYKLIGITRRDIQVWVDNCDKNNPPKLLGPYAHNVCEGDKICFDIRSKDEPVVVPPPGVSQVPDTTQLTWNKGIPGATFTIKDPKVRERVGEFCWEPKIGQASSLPYTFTVTARDQACPRPAITIRGYSVTVKKKALGERFYDTFPCGKLVFRCEPEVDFQGVPKYLWTLKSLDQTQFYYSSARQKDSFRFRKGGTYIAELILNNSASCPTVYLDTIEIPKFIEVELAVGDTFVCENDGMKLVPRIGYANKPIIYDWTYATTGEQISTDSVITVFPTQDTSVAIFVTDADQCTNTDTVFIHWQKLSRPWLGGDERICTYDTFQIVVPYDTLLSYRWNDGIVGTDTTLTVNVEGQYWLHTIDSLGCYGRDTFELFVNDTVVAQAGVDDIICKKELYELKGGRENDSTAIHVWNWYNLTTNAMEAATQNYEVSPPDSTKYRLHLRITEGGVMCEDNDTMFLRVNALPDLSTVRNPAPKCFDDGQFDLGAEAPIGANFKWSEKANSDVWYTMDDPGRDTMVRKGTATPNWYYTQRFFNTDMNIGVPSNGRDDVWIHVKHIATGCIDSAKFTARINPNPVVFLQDLTRCQDAGSFRINPAVVRAPANPDAGRYTWVIDSAPVGVSPANYSQILEDKSPNPLFSHDYWFNPMVPGTLVDDIPNPSRLGTYKLMFCYEDGTTNCRTCDSTYITVEKLPEIQFSPFDKFCYNDDTIQLDDYVNLPQGRWELIRFNASGPGTGPYNTAVARMIDSSAINVNDPSGAGGTYYWRYVNVTTGCPVKDSVLMDVSAQPRLTLTIDDTLCLTNGLFDLSSYPVTDQPFASGGPSTGFYGNGVTGSDFDPTAVLTPNNTQAVYGAYMVYARYEHPVTSCTNVDSTPIYIQAPPEITITTPSPISICEGDDITVDATAIRAEAGTLWTTSGDGNFNDNTALNTVYTHGAVDRTSFGATLTISSNQPDYLRNCPATTVDIPAIVHAYPVIKASPFDSGCTPVITNFNANLSHPDPASYNMAYFWDFGNGQTATDSAPQGITFTQEGPYEVKLQVTNTDGNCVTRDSATLINVFPIPVASIASNPDYYTTVALPKFQFTSTSTISTGGFSLHQWNFDDGVTDSGVVVEHPYSDDTAEYNVSLLVISDKKCRDSITKTIKIGPDITVFIPSAFSPDGAGPPRNNKLYVSAQGYIGYNLKIYNRWGEQLFESNHPEDEPWDGNYDGEPAQQDVYMYIAKVIAFDGNEYEYSGTVTLIR